MTIAPADVRDLLESHLDVSWVLRDMRTTVDEMKNDLIRRFGSPPKEIGRKKKKKRVHMYSTLVSDISSVARDSTRSNVSNASRRADHVLADLPMNEVRVEGRPTRAASRVASTSIKSLSTLNLRTKMRRPAASASIGAPSRNSNEENVSETVSAAENEAIGNPQQLAAALNTPESSVGSMLETSKTAIPMTVIKVNPRWAMLEGTGVKPKEPIAAKRKLRRPFEDNNCSPIRGFAADASPETVRKLRRTRTRPFIEDDISHIARESSSALTSSADCTLTKVSPVVSSTLTINTPSGTNKKSSASMFSFLESTHNEEGGLDIAAGRDMAGGVVTAGGNPPTPVTVVRKTKRKPNFNHQESVVEQLNDVEIMLGNETFAIPDVPAEQFVNEGGRRTVSTHYEDGGLAKSVLGGTLVTVVKKTKQKPDFTYREPIIEPSNGDKMVLGSETFAIPDVPAEHRINESGTGTLSTHYEEMAACGDALVTVVKKTKRKPDFTYREPIIEPSNGDKMVLGSETFAIPDVPAEHSINEGGTGTLSTHYEEMAAGGDALVTVVKKAKRKPKFTHQDPAVEPFNDFESLAIPNVPVEHLAKESGRRTRTLSKYGASSDESKAAPETSTISEDRPKRTRRKATGARPIVDSEDSDSFIAGTPVFPNVRKNKKNKKAAANSPDVLTIDIPATDCDEAGHGQEPNVAKPRSTRTRTVRKRTCEASWDLGDAVDCDTFVIPEVPIGPPSTRTRTLAVASSLDLPEITQGRPKRVRTKTRRFNSSESETDNKEPTERPGKKRDSAFYVLPAKVLSSKVRTKDMRLSGLRTSKGAGSATRTSNRFKTPFATMPKKIRMATKKLADDDNTAKNSELRQKKGQLALQSREDQLGKKAKELKRKNNEKMERVLKTKQKLETVKQEQILQVEREKELKRQQLIEERRQQRLEEIQKKKQAEAKKMVEAEERRKLEEEARLAKVREQELEAQRLINEKRRQQELEEKRAKERLEEIKKLREAAKAMNQRMAKRAVELQEQKAQNPPTPIALRYKPRNENDLGLEDEHSENSDEETPQRPEKKVPDWVRGMNYE